MTEPTTGQPGATPGPGLNPDPGATPGQAQTGEGATPEPSSSEGAMPDAPLGDAGREALDRERTARREADRQLGELRRRVAEMEDAGKPELERAQGAARRIEVERDAAHSRVQELESKIAALELRDLQRQVAAEHGFAPELASRLQGDDLRTLRADAKEFAERLGSQTPVGDLGGGRGGAATSNRRGDMNQRIREGFGR